MVSYIRCALRSMIFAALCDTQVDQRRWDNCFIRLLDGMLQVLGFADSDGVDHSLRIPVRIRHIEIRAPGGVAAPTVACNARRLLGRVVTPLATLQGLELAAAPRSDAPATTKCEQQLNKTHKKKDVVGMAAPALACNTKRTMGRAFTPPTTL